MAKIVTDYSQYITKTEQEILNALTASISDPEVVQAIYEEIIKQRENTSSGYDSFYGAGKDIACSNDNKNISVNVDDDVIKELVKNSHTRNQDTKLQGYGTNEIINSNAEGNKIVSFKIADKEVAYIAGDGRFVGKIGSMTTEEAERKLEGAVTAEEVNRVLAGKVNKVDILGPDGKIKEEVLPDIVPEGLQEHLDNKEIHVTSQKKAEWDAKFDMPDDGITEAHLSDGVKELINKSPDKLLNQQGHILDKHLNFEKIATKDDVKAVNDKVTSNKEVTDALGQRVETKLDKPSGGKAGFVKVTAENATSVAENISDGDIVISPKIFTGNLKDVSISSIDDILNAIDNLVTGPNVIEDINFGVYK